MIDIKNLTDKLTENMGAGEKNAFSVLSINAVLGVLHAIAKMIRENEAITVASARIKDDAPETGDFAIFLGLDEGADAVVKLAKAAYQNGPEWVSGLEVDDSRFEVRGTGTPVAGLKDDFDFRRN